MKSLEESIARSMECEQIEILPYLPYILQDFDEIGTPPETIVALIKKHQKKYPELNVLDLGCGKGAVSIKISNELKCSCLGIDGIPEFIKEAQQKSLSSNLSHLCKYEIGDIRVRINSLQNFDVVVLGSIGDVFGNYYATLSKVSQVLNRNGIIIIDDGYLRDEVESNDTELEKRGIIVQCGKQLGINLIDEIIVSEKSQQQKIYDKELKFIVKRCAELMERYPLNKKIFLEYMEKQKEEYDVLKNAFISSTMVFKR